MDYKTKIEAIDGKQELIITRQFNLPVELLFKAYVEAELIEQWMGTKVIKIENKKHGYYQFETTDPKGNKHGFNGTIHEYILNKKITRTFEMENTTLPIQLEFLEFEMINKDSSMLRMHIVYKSIEVRKQILKMPFAFGINMAHNRLEEIMIKSK